MDWIEVLLVGCVLCVTAAAIWFGYWIAVIAVVVILSLLGFVVTTILVVLHDQHML